MQLYYHLSGFSWPLDVPESMALQATILYAAGKPEFIENMEAGGWRLEAGV